MNYQQYNEKLTLYELKQNSQSWNTNRCMAGSEENWYLEIVMETVAEIDILNVLSHFVLDCPISFWRIM